MKQSRANVNVFSVFAAVAYAAALVCLGSAALAPTYAQGQGNTEYCEITLTGCPQDYNGKALRVPPRVIALSTQVRACGIQDSSQGIGEAPAVMFVIDHSWSMRLASAGGNFSGGNDANGNRFRVTKALIDSIYAKHPQAEVGVAVFSDTLVFNASRDSNLVRLAGGGAYMPLMQLDQPAKRGGSAPFYPAANQEAPKAIDVFDNMFYAPANVNQRAYIVDPTTATTPRGAFNEIQGTNITAAFQAAREAFTKTAKPERNQYIIFLSDGAPTNPTPCNDSTDITLPCNSFAVGANTPTTYTVFLQAGATAATLPPVLITQMTNNIKANGYSETNPSSAVWVLANNSYSDLLAFMMENIVTPMLSKSNGDATRITISSGGVTDSTGDLQGGSFTFRRNLPMDTAETTNILMNVKYDVRVDSTKENGEDTSFIRRGQPFEYSFTVRRTTDTTRNWESDQELRSNCGARPTLELQYQGENLSVPGKVVKGNMNRLTIVFSNTGGLFNYGNDVVVQVRNADGTITDVENFTLARSGNTYTYTFPRIELKEGEQASLPNTFEHAAQDSVILIFRNREIPLDTIRVSVPYLSSAMAFYDKPGDPVGATELPGAITATAGDTLRIFAKIFGADGIWDEAMTSDKSKITWSISGGQSDHRSITGDGAEGKFYSETANGTVQYTVTATYKDGTLVISKSVVVTVQPGAPEILEVVFDSSKINRGRILSTSYLENNKNFEFGKNATDTVFYAVKRDRFGNFIGLAENATWVPNTSSLTATPENGRSSRIKRVGSSFGDNVYVVVTEGELIDSVKITVVGESAVTIGPNPFVPGVSEVREKFRSMDQSGSVEQYYENILKEPSRGGSSSGGGDAGNPKGVLVAATSPKAVKFNTVGDRKYAVATIVIYDAVGNVVFKSKQNDIAMVDDNTFGFVWNGKNNSGRTVGPGTYLVRMSVTQSGSGGGKFVEQRAIGVTVR